MSEVTLFFIGQSAVILMAFAAGYVGIKVQIAKLEVKVSSLKEDHSNLAEQVRGISRGVATLTGKMSERAAS